MANETGAAFERTMEGLILEFDIGEGEAQIREVAGRAFDEGHAVGFLQARSGKGQRGRKGREKCSRSQAGATCLQRESKRLVPLRSDRETRSKMSMVHRPVEEFSTDRLCNGCQSVWYMGRSIDARRRAGE